MIQGWLDKFVANRAFNALYWYACTINPHSDEHNNIVIVLDHLRKRL